MDNSELTAPHELEWLKHASESFSEPVILIMDYNAISQVVAEDFIFPRLFKQSLFQADQADSNHIHTLLVTQP